MNEILEEVVLDNLGKDNYNDKDLLNIKSLYFDDVLDLTGIEKISNITEITLSHVIITIDDCLNLKKLPKLIKLNILNSNITIMEELSKLNIEELYIKDSFIDEYKFINNFNNLKVLSLLNYNEVDLKDFSIIRKLNKIYLDGTKIANENYLFYANECSLLSISSTNINDISLLLSLENLKYLYLDKNILEKNVRFAAELKKNGVTIQLIGGSNEIL